MITTDPLPVNVHINKMHIWPSGSLGKVTLAQDFGDDIDLTCEQARSLITVLQMKLKEME